MRLIPRRRLRIGVFGYDLKFIRPLMGEMSRSDRHVIRSVESGSLHAFPNEEVERLVRWADVLVGEFLSPTIGTLAGLRTRGQPIVARLHRFEYHRGFLDVVDRSSIARLVCVDRHYADLATASGWEAGRIEVIPNAIDIARFERPKVPSSTTTLGMIGVASARKRLDLGLDILEAVRADVPDAVLALKGSRPDEAPRIMDDPDERRYFEDLSPRLRALERDGRIVWSPFGDDVPSWLTEVGYVLSTSDDESFHMAPAEGMASGSIPSIRRWPGADGVYANEWLWDRPREASRRIVEFIRDPDRRRTAIERARSEARSFDLPVIARSWLELIDEVAR